MSGALAEPFWGQHFKSKAGMRVYTPEANLFIFQTILPVFVDHCQFLSLNELLCIKIRPRLAADHNSRHLPTSHAYLYTADTAGLFCSVRQWVASLHRRCELLPRHDIFFRDTKCIASTDTSLLLRGQKSSLVSVEWNCPECHMQPMNC